MGKYMRKRTGRAPAAELAQVVVGVRTRSRSAAAFASAVAAPKRTRKQATVTTRAEVEAGRGDGGCAAAAGCYLQLRSRRLFMAAPAEVRCCPVPAEEKAALPGAARSGGASVEPVMVVVAGISRCSSTASSVDIVAVARERSGGAAEARDEPDVESAVSDSDGCGRERREATPSSRPPADLTLSDEESSQAADHPKHHRMSLPAATAAVAACRARRMPAEEEIEEFFAAAEKAEAERFAAKYNFDVARGLPLDAGRYEWTTVASG